MPDPEHPAKGTGNSDSTPFSCTEAERLSFRLALS